MTSNSPQNMTTITWNALPEAEKTRIILQIQQKTNSIKLEIDTNQKKLDDMRKTIPEECLKMFEEEKKLLLKRYTTAELLPNLVREGLSEDETQNMITNIKKRAEAQAAHQEETRIENEQLKKVRQEKDQLCRQIRELAEEILEYYED